MKRNREKKNQLDPNLSQDHTLDLGQNPDHGHGLVPSPVATNSVTILFLGMNHSFTHSSVFLNYQEYDVATVLKRTSFCQFSL